MNKDVLRGECERVNRLLNTKIGQQTYISFFCVSHNFNV